MPADNENSAVRQLLDIAGNLAVSHKAIESALALNRAARFASFDILPDAQKTIGNYFVSQEMDLSLYSGISAGIIFTNQTLSSLNIGIAYIAMAANLGANPINSPFFMTRGLELQNIGNGYATVAQSGFPVPFLNGTLTNGNSEFSLGFVAQGGFGLCRFVMDWNGPASLGANALTATILKTFKGKVFATR